MAKRTSPNILVRSPELKALSAAILFGFATADDFRGADPEDVFAIKSDPDAVHYRTATHRPIRSKADDSASDEPSREFWFVASEESVDRMGDIVTVRGWKLANMKKNPQALWGHDHDKPVGLVTGFEKALELPTPQLREAITYHTEEVCADGEAMFRLVEAGAIKATSVGFIPLEKGALRPTSPEQRAEWGLGPWGVKYINQEQIELSNCTVPMHPAALRLRGGKTARAERDRLVDACKKLVRKGKLSARAAREFSARLGEKQSFALAPVRVVRASSTREPALRAEIADLRRELGLVVGKQAVLERSLGRLEKNVACVASVARAIEPTRKSDPAAFHGTALLRAVAARM